MKYNVVVFKLFIHLAALLPLINAYYLALTDQLGADPVESIIHFTGIGAFNLLLLSLAITPISKRFKISILLKVRRLVGLYSFTYAFCHLLNFLVFEVHNMLHHLIRMCEVVGHENTAVGLHFIFNFLVHHNRHNCRLMVAPVLTARLLQTQVAVIH